MHRLRQLLRDLSRPGHFCAEGGNGVKVLMKGNEALAEAAVRAGCRYFFGYPITPQTEISEYLARRLPGAGGVFLQAESEVAAINMVYGAAGAGARVMTSSSGPGISLKQEGISYIAGAELPCVIVNIMRGGPGLGGIQPSQSDYFQATRGGGHGDYRLPVLAPSNVQELVDLTCLAFDLADEYRTPVLILGDGILGQMMEAVELPPVRAAAPEKTWATTGCRGRAKNVITSFFMDAADLERHNLRLQEKYRAISAREARGESYLTGDAGVLVVAFGSTARIAKAAVRAARAEGIAAGLFRPVTLWPFPAELLNRAALQAGAVLTVEMNYGQMVEDVRLALDCRLPVHFYGRGGGMVPGVGEIFREIVKLGGETRERCRVKPA
ncbi:MAG: 3-methyl-2-oxobutanoate dehydrogenase subunit VorB [Peptococcaceae bacterium]|nr:3-methyl-2-oxobutanoate dehydrogenase subunit VorB [Peptococcaceae bacterium]